MKLRIVNDQDGIGYLTKVINAETGEPLLGIVSIKWEFDVSKRKEYGDGLARAYLVLDGVEIDVVTEAEIEKAAW
jgi:hypothetical protein